MIFDDICAYVKSRIRNRVHVGEVLFLAISQ